MPDKTPSHARDAYPVRPKPAPNLDLHPGQRRRDPIGVNGPFATGPFGRDHGRKVSKLGGYAHGCLISCTFGSSPLRMSSLDTFACRADKPRSATPTAPAAPA